VPLQRARRRCPAGVRGQHHGDLRGGPPRRLALQRHRQLQHLRHRRAARPPRGHLVQGLGPDPRAGLGQAEAHRSPSARLEDPDRLWRTFEAPAPSVDGYRVIWVHSSVKAANDAPTRAARDVLRPVPTTVAPRRTPTTAPRWPPSPEITITTQDHITTRGSRSEAARTLRTVPTLHTREAGPSEETGDSSIHLLVAVAQARADPGPVVSGLSDRAGAPTERSSLYWASEQ